MLEYFPSTKLQPKHAALIGAMLQFHQDHGGEWPTIVQISALIDRDRRGTHKTMTTLRRREAVVAFRGKSNLVTYGVTEIGSALGAELDPEGFAKYAAFRRAKPGKGKRPYRDRLLEASKPQLPPPPPPEIVREELLCAIREWHGVMEEWPTRVEITQMAEDFDVSTVVAGLRDLIRAQRLTPLLYVCPRTTRGETRYRLPRAA